LRSFGFSLGTTYGTKISFNGGGKWPVYRNGGFVNNSATCHGSSAPEMQAGGESTSNADVLTGDGNNLMKRGSDNSPGRPTGAAPTSSATRR
jgi:hypothetical protein